MGGKHRLLHASAARGCLDSLYRGRKAALVTVLEKHSPFRDGTFADWTALVSRWDERSTPFALAVAGSAPLADGPLEPIPLDNPEYKAIVSKYLKSHGLHVDQPFLTQAFHIP